MVRPDAERSAVLLGPVAELLEVAIGPRVVLAGAEHAPTLGRPQAILTALDRNARLEDHDVLETVGAVGVLVHLLHRHQSSPRFGRGWPGCPLSGQGRGPGDSTSRCTRILTKNHTTPECA